MKDGLNIIRSLAVDKEIARGDGFAGGVIRQGKVMLWERWEVREVSERFIGIYLSEFVSPELYENDRLLLLLPTPTYINLN